MSDRIARLEGSYDALKVVRPMTITVIGILLAALIFVLSFMASELRDVKSGLEATNGKIDAVQRDLNSKLEATNGKIDAVQRDLNSKLEATNTKIDGIPAKLADEFRAMRAEMAAQTSAIANSITAAHQMQPQIIVVPMPPIERPAPTP